MRCFDRKTTIPPRKWTRRGMLILLALFALMTHSIVRSGKASATGISPVAITIYGQGNYTSSGASRGTGGLTNPHAVALDGSGDLYVADTGNNRVLYFPAGSTTATGVYGQDASFTDATANNGGVSVSSLSAPAGVALDLNNNLYIADTGNNRILYYPSGQATATRVYGQGGDFTGNAANNNGIGSASLSSPAGVALDANGNIYSADTLNNRVLQYQDKLHVTNQPATITIDDSFSIAFSLTDVGSGLAFADFAGSVSLLIKSGSGRFIAVYCLYALAAWLRPGTRR